MSFSQSASVGSWNQQAMELVRKIGNKIFTFTVDNREAAFLFQRLSVSVAGRNVVFET